VLLSRTAEASKSESTIERRRGNPLVVGVVGAKASGGQCCSLSVAGQKSPKLLWILKYNIAQIAEVEVQYS
jgi:hypothetical protein